MSRWQYRLFVNCPSERPVFWTIPAFVWGDGRGIDTDGDSVPATSRTWTELYAALRADEATQRFDISPIQDEPLILQVISDDLRLVFRVAYILAYSTGGKIARQLTDEYQPPEQFLSELGEDFDLGWAIQEFQKALQRKR